MFNKLIKDIFFHRFPYRLYRLAVFILCIAIFGFIVLTKMSEQKQLLVAQNNANLQPSSSNCVNKPVFPESNLEWFDLYKKLPVGSLNQFVIIWKTRGKVVDITNEPGKRGGFKSYYVGEEGYYQYLGRVTLIGENGRKNILSLGKKRMEMLKVYKNMPNGIEERSFNEIKVGDNIELEESVDLVISNINDENLRYLTIRIL